MDVTGIKTVRPQKGRWIAAGAVAFLMLASACGCEEDLINALKTDKSRFFSPDKIVSAPAKSSINPILSTVSIADPYELMVPNATLPAEEDYEYAETEYLIGPADVLDVSVMDLFQESVETVLRRTVSETGNIDMPLINRAIKAGGLTQRQLRNTIAEAYETAGLLASPVVSVAIVTQRQNVFSTLGAIARPGTYTILRRDMRLLEALSLAGGFSQSNLKYLYVIRQTGESAGKAAGLEDIPLPAPLTRPGEGTDAGKGAGTGPASPYGAEAPVQPQTQPTAAELEKVMQTDSAASASAESPRAAEKNAATQPASQPAGWDFRGGQWVRRAGAAKNAAADPYGWSKVTRLDTARIIAINIARLNAGDPKMNIIVRDNDVLHVPPLEAGEFYISGEVQRPGAYSMTGRQVTIKMALAAAGNLGPLAWPDNCVLIRRVGAAQEQVIPINVEAIFKGNEPDIFLKPDDVVAVGTDVRAQFYAVLRNAFRMTYGFGFIYDRNFSDPLLPALQQYRYDSSRFTRW
ncbi:MAG: polysaccharide biosynthesis/export family protein [Planctomycetes bacterium]|nr:polysaccharide biosynthesis/export family protein [Planctomycetota bacterium]